ncbi:MAG: hypothetical protein M0C28_35270 [Candidatus Moduliflexus flocculans]|nr:hypothetical protein [Candidatus Moduliflexus flocculans]
MLTTDAAIAKKIDKAVFPGEQGGPHVHVFAALALTFKLARRPRSSRILQEQTIKNAVAMADQFKKRGLRVPFGGTNYAPAQRRLHAPSSHRMAPPSPATSAVRILDMVGIVVNRNTIPGDKNSRSTRRGIRLGTPWITQRGFDEAKTRQLADIMADVLLACRAASHRDASTQRRTKRRAKLDFNVLNDARLKVRALAEIRRRGFQIHDTRLSPLLLHWTTKSQRRLRHLSGFRVRQFLDYAARQRHLRARSR